MCILLLAVSKCGNYYHPLVVLSINMCYILFIYIILGDTKSNHFYYQSTPTDFSEDTHENQLKFKLKNCQTHD